MMAYEGKRNGAKGRGDLGVHLEVVVHFRLRRPRVQVGVLVLQQEIHANITNILYV